MVDGQMDRWKVCHTGKLKSLKSFQIYWKVLKQFRNILSYFKNFPNHTRTFHLFLILTADDTDAWIIYSSIKIETQYWVILAGISLTNGNKISLMSIAELITDFMTCINFLIDV